MENKWHQIKCQMSAMNKNAGIKEDRKCQGWGAVIFTEWLMFEQRCEGAGKEGASPLPVGRALQAERTAGAEALGQKHSQHAGKQHRGQGGWAERAKSNVVRAAAGDVMGEGAG